MAFETLTPNMNLPAPGVGQTDGPQWAIDLNDCLTLLDQHDHSPGAGVQITPGGLDINSDLTIGNNNLTNIKSARFQIQGSPLSGGADLTCLYSSGVDLYFNDGDGNQIQITAAGGVAGTPGSIANLVSPASATWVALSETFVWQSDSNVAANMDMRSIILRNSSVSSNGITINAPTPLSANYTLTLMGALPASNKILQVDNSGAITSVLGVDNSTIVITSNNLTVPTSGITATQLAPDSVITSKILDGNVTAGKLASDSVTTVKILDGNVTYSKMSALNAAISGDTGTFSTTSTTMTTVTNSGLGITTHGNPVQLMLIAFSGPPRLIGTNSATAYTYEMQIIIDGATTRPWTQFTVPANGGTAEFQVPASMVDFPAAGAHSYAVQIRRVGGTGAPAVGLFVAALYAFELR